MTFPEKFRWGAATASYQIEGSPSYGDRGKCVWDMFSNSPGKTFEGHNGKVACDHYNRFRDDVGLMAKIGLQAYRLSISWPRILPDGSGRVNEKGLAFYDLLIDELLKNGIEPWVTLFHWDFPISLFYRGGWLSRDSVDWFAGYTKIVVDRLGDRVQHWITLNEPQCFIGMGHRDGAHAPGLQLDWPEVLTAAHHAMMAHGRAVQIIRERSKLKSQVGFAPCGIVKYPFENNPDHFDAARHATFAVDQRSLWNNSWWTEPVLNGRYPDDGLRTFGLLMPRFNDTDLSVMHQPLDFYGVNIYHGDPIRSDGSSPKRKPGFPRTMIRWPVEPDTLYWGPRFFYERYGLPIVITENGLSCHDWVDRSGDVCDPNRIDFTRAYLKRYADAIRDGIPALGYFHWSLMDNFEWAEGYSHRFGLIHVDFETQKRTLKSSARWYAKVIKSNGGILDESTHWDSSLPE